MGVVGELRLGAFLRVMPRALQAFLAPGGGDLQGIARSAGEAVTTETSGDDGGHGAVKGAVQGR